MIVDHVNDPLASLAKAPLPDGVRASTEERNRNTVHFAEVVPTAGESVDQAGKRLVSALVGLKLPPGDRWAFGKTSDDTVRSLLVAGAPVVTEANVAEASAYAAARRALLPAPRAAKHASQNLPQEIVCHSLLPSWFKALTLNHKRKNLTCPQVSPRKRLVLTCAEGHRTGSAILTACPSDRPVRQRYWLAPLRRAAHRSQP